MSTLGMSYVELIFKWPCLPADLGCLEVCEDVLDGAGDQGDGLDLGEALGEVLNVSEEDVHENDFAKYISSRYYLISSVAKLY
jgi:hypothetical protein